MHGYSQKISLGLESFIGVSNNYNTAVDTGFRESYGLTLLSTFPLKNNIFLRTGLGFDKNGYTYELSDSGQEGTIESKGKITHNYFLIPLYIKFSSIGKDGKISIVSGLYYSYMLSEIEKRVGYATFTDGRDREDWDTKENVTDKILNLGRNDIGINLEVDREMMSKGGFVIDLGLYSKIGFLSAIKPDYGKNYSFGSKLVVSKSINK